MKCEDAITLLQRHEAQLIKLGVERLAAFGSTARDEAGGGSDVDGEVRLTESQRGFAHLRRLDEVRDLLTEILGRSVDVIAEDAGSPRLRHSVAREREHAF